MIFIYIFIYIRSYFIDILIFIHVAMVSCRLVYHSSAFITGVFEMQRCVSSIRVLRRLGDDGRWRKAVLEQGPG